MRSDPTRWWCLVLLVCAVGLLLALPPAAWAQDTEEGAPDEAGGGKSITFLDSIKSSGLIGLVLGLMSIWMVAVVINSFIRVRRGVLLPGGFLEEFKQHLDDKKFPDALTLARENGSMIARILAAGLGRLTGGYRRAVDAMQETGADENMKLEHGIGYLAIIATISPMLGLLGTVYGMIVSFNKIASSGGQPKPDELAGGISLALMTTLMGLTVAIPALAAYSVLKNRIARVTLEVGMAVEELMGRFSGVGVQK